MAKKNLIKNVYWLESSKSKVMPWQKCMIAQSRNLLRTILSLKHQEMIKKRKLKSQDENKKQIQKNENLQENISRHEGKQRMGDQISFNQKKVIQIREIQQKKMRDSINSDFSDQEEEYSQFFTQFLRNLLLSAQDNKNKLKIEKGLSLDKDFVLENFHFCQYCGKKFLKPCSLGGHISKLHWEERKREKENVEIQEWEFETPVRRK